jgi:Flavoprotein
MASFSSSTVAATQPRHSPLSSRTTTASSDEMTKEEDNDISAHTTAKLTFSETEKPSSNTSSNPREKSLREKYHPVDAAGKPLHAKIANATVTNPHHTHLDVDHPSPVRLPIPSRINDAKYVASKLGKTEKMKIDKYEDGKKHILVGATGSVASVKIPLIVKSLLAHEEVEVQVIVTKAAKHFFDVEKLKTELGVKVWEDDDDWKVFHLLPLF